MLTSWKRLTVVALLGLVIAGAVLGLAIRLDSSQSGDNAQLRTATHQRSALTAALMDSVLAARYRSFGSDPSAGRGAKEAVTGSPFTAWFGPGERLVAARPALTAVTRRLIAGQPALAQTMRDGRAHLSAVVPAGHGHPAGVLYALPYSRSGHRFARVFLLPLAEISPALDQYLRDVAHFALHADTAHTYVIDSRGVVIGSSVPSVRTGQPVGDRSLRAALTGVWPAGRYGRTVFATVTPLSVAPWRVVYTVPYSILYGPRGAAWKLSFLLLAAFGAAAVVCLFLLVRLLARTSELHRANRALAERNRELQGATEAKSRFVANLSHELRNPLGAVIGYSELMHAGRLGPLAERQREHLGVIRGSAEHILELIDELLDLARIESGHTRLDPQPLEPAEVASACVTSLSRAAETRHIRVVLEAAAAGQLMLDPTRLRQVILNFLSNAIKFTPSGGSVRLALRRDASWLAIEVTDTGVGIDPSDQDRVFDEFFQVPGSEHRGTGLGLAVTKRIVEAQGGRVGVDSPPGAGSTFSAWLPLVPIPVDRSAELEALSGDHGSDARASGRRALIRVS